MPPDDLEDIVDRALKRLPPPRAPHTLLPRVMAAQALRSRRARPWLSWPLGLQIASVAAMVVLSIGIVRWWPGVEATMVQQAPTVVSSTAEAMWNAASAVADAAGTVGALLNATRALWRALLQPVVGYVLVLVLVMCAACATFGAALGRVALGGVSQT